LSGHSSTIGFFHRNVRGSKKGKKEQKRQKA